MNAKTKKKLLNRPHALDQNFLTFAVAYGEDDHLARSTLATSSSGKKGQTYKLKGSYHTKAVISKLRSQRTAEAQQFEWGSQDQAQGWPPLLHDAAVFGAKGGSCQDQ